MKLITAVIKPFKVDDVKDALKEAGVAGVTVTEVVGFGRQVGPHRGVPRCRVHGRLPAQAQGRGALRRRRRRPASRQVIVDAARTGSIGDGKIWIIDVARVMRVRTGELDADAI